MRKHRGRVRGLSPRMQTPSSGSHLSMRATFSHKGEKEERTDAAAQQAAFCSPEALPSTAESCSIPPIRVAFVFLGGVLP
jgi:hypothetical protein